MKTENRRIIREFLMDALRNARWREVAGVLTGDKAEEARAHGDISDLETAMIEERLANPSDFDGAAISAWQRPHVEFSMGTQPGIVYDSGRGKLEITVPQRGLEAKYLHIGFHLYAATRQANENGGSFNDRYFFED